MNFPNDSSKVKGTPTPNVYKLLVFVSIGEALVVKLKSVAP